MSTSADELVTFLKKLPPNVTLEWSDSSLMATDTVFYANYLDVFVPEICEALKWAWIWTVENPTLLAEDSLKYSWVSGQPVGDHQNISLLPDTTIWSVTDQFSHSPVDVTCLTHSANVTLSESQKLELANNYAPDKVTDFPGWSVATVNEILTQWVTAATGREDISFKFVQNLSDPFLTKALETMDRITKGQEQTYQISENVFASSSTMDTLLALDPQDAAEITKVIKQLLSEKSGE